MLTFLSQSFIEGLRRIRDYPQLAYTLFIAVVILSAFAYLAYAFVGIARDAQEELYDVRIASLQDAFVQFAGDELRYPEMLEEKIQAIGDLNSTIVYFVVVDVTDPDFPVIASLTEGMTTDRLTESDIRAIELAQVHRDSSLRLEREERSERLFVDARAIKDSSGRTVAVSLVTHTLSEADVVAQSRVRNSVLLFSGIVILVLVLFFRHARIIDYASLYKKLQGVDQLKDDFISMASHELRSPLTAIRGYAEFLFDERDQLSVEQKDYIDKIRISARRLDSLVADMLDVSRIEQGRMTFEYETRNPRKDIEQVVEQFDRQAKEKGLKLSFDHTESALVEVDPGRLKQVLINLLSNAVKYTEHGEVRVKSYVENGKQIIRVSDTGVGMSKEEQDQLFGKFTRVGSARTKQIRGTGLGLWISKQIVEEMGGTITVESIAGKGSDFIVKLPVVTTEEG